MNEQKEYISFPTGDFFTNAGLVGLKKMLDLVDDEFNPHYIILDDEIKIEKEYFLSLDLTQAYFDTLIKEFEKDSSFFKVEELINKTIFLLNEKNNELKKIKENLKLIKEKLDAASYKTGCKIIKDILNQDYNLHEELKILINQKDPFLIIERLEQLRSFLKIDTVRETLLMKNIAYTVINNFWEGKSFLNRNKSKSNMKEAHFKDFEEPLKQYLINQKPRKEYCIECGELIKGNDEKISITFMKDTGDDFSRKKSAFWNFKVNAFVCPKCAFIYTLVPLGFKRLGWDYIFVNQNNSLYSLIKANDTSKRDDIIYDENRSFNEIFNYLIAEKERLKLNQMFNIQVIIRLSEENRYSFSIIEKKTLEIIELCHNELKSLMNKKNIKIDKKYINIYQKVLLNILNNINQYQLINELNLLSLRKETEYVKWYIYSIVSIQLKINALKEKNINMKGEKKMGLKSNYWFMAQKGKELRNKICEGSNDDSAILGVSYKLLNALKQGNIHQFMDVIIRLYNSNKLQLPMGFISTLNNTKEFKDIGYAFMLGFRGTLYSSDNQKKDEALIDKEVENEKR